MSIIFEEKTATINHSCRHYFDQNL